jgi:hypothetical protein
MSICVHCVVCVCFVSYYLRWVLESIVDRDLRHGGPVGAANYYCDTHCDVKQLTGSSLEQWACEAYAENGCWHGLSTPKAHTRSQYQTLETSQGRAD